MTQGMRSKAFELIRQSLRRFGWVAFDKQVDVIGHDLQGLDLDLQLFRSDTLRTTPDDISAKKRRLHFAGIVCHP